MRCGARLVAVEALAPAVVAVCGEPSYRDRREPLDPTAGLPDEVWYYDRGPNQLIRVLSFRDQRLERIEEDGYGFSGGSEGRCSPTTMQEGISKYRLLRMCGEPVSKRVESGLTSYPPSQVYRDRSGRLVYGGGYLAPVYRETWIYNFGPSRFLRRVTLENGVLARWEDENQRGY